MSEPETGVVHTTDAFDQLPELPENSVHAVVTDPPYGLAFMGRSWDDFEPKEYQEWCERWAREVKRVLKPGGHLLAFSGNRTHHRAFTGVEDAGFEIRDTVTWHYGSGFPKALDVSKAIDKQADAEREVVGPKISPDGSTYNERRQHDNTQEHEGYQRPWKNDPEKVERNNMRTAPATDAAERWDGFKTALKPATEYVVLARKPLSEGTVAENVQTHGTGALNIDGTRIETSERPERKETNDLHRPNTYNGDEGGSKATGTTTEGRYPSNVVFDETEAERLDREVGELETGGGVRNSNEREKYGEYDGGETRSFPSNSGGPSRYFYTSKASKAERTNDGAVPNDHPTVKPTDLMEWLVTLITARDQIVLDPFTGSGTTGLACKATDRRFIGIERDPGHADTARARIGYTPNDPSRFRDADESGLDAFTD